MHLIITILLSDFLISSIIYFLSGSNNISSSLKKLNNVISYPHTSPYNENIVSFFIFFPK